MKTEATERAEMPKGTSSVLDMRTLQTDYHTLLPILAPGLTVLDVGCGTGAITKGIAEICNSGYVVGIDSSAHLIAKGKRDFGHVENLSLIEADLFNFSPDRQFDLIVSARVLQWLHNPLEALQKMKAFLKPGGQISILDYNHTLLCLEPEPPANFQKFYQLFLRWRADAGMNNQIADDLPAYFEQSGFSQIEVFNADEVYKKGEDNFIDKAGIWLKVAELRGPQMGDSGYLTQSELLEVIDEYAEWISTKAELMIMKLKEVRAKVL